MSGHICRRAEEWAADERRSSGFPPIKQERSAEIRWICVHLGKCVLTSVTVQRQRVLSERCVIARPCHLLSVGGDSPIAFTRRTHVGLEGTDDSFSADGSATPRGVTIDRIGSHKIEPISMLCDLIDRPEDISPGLANFEMRLSRFAWFDLLRGGGLRCSSLEIFIFLRRG